MNIFILSWILEQCAQYHCDKHVNKMIIETAQLLSSCWHKSDPTLASQYVDQNKIYRPSHQHHPCAYWLRQCKENYIWLCHLGFELLKEKAYRFETEVTDHKCYPILQFLITHVPTDLPSNNGVITMPRMAMPDQYKCQDPVLSYRVYYLNDKQSMLVWRKRSPPPWVPKSLHHIHYNSEIARYGKKLEKLENRKTKTQEHLDQITSLQTIIDGLKEKLSNL